MVKVPIYTSYSDWIRKICKFFSRSNNICSTFVLAGKTKAFSESRNPFKYFEQVSIIKVCGAVLHYHKLLIGENPSHRFTETFVLKKKGIVLFREIDNWVYNIYNIVKQIIVIEHPV